MLKLAKWKLEKIVAQKGALPVEIAMDPVGPYRECLKETFGGNWGCFSRVVGVDDEFVIEEKFFQFKTDADAILFKLRFGGAPQQ